MLNSTSTKTKYHERKRCTTAETARRKRQHEQKKTIKQQQQFSIKKLHTKQKQRRKNAKPSHGICQERTKKSTTERRQCRANAHYLRHPFPE